MNIADVLCARAREHPGAPAIIDTFRGRRRVTTFADLDSLADRGATTLIQNGIRPGESVLLLQPMSVELYAALVAVFRAGAVATFLDPSAGLSHIGKCAEIYAPRAFIASPRAHLLRLVSGAIRRIPTKFSTGMSLPGAVAFPATRRSSLPETSSDAALLTFTSGSTGFPKAALRTHEFLMAQYRVLEATLGLTEGTVDMATLPVFVLANLASGVTSLIPNADLRRPGQVDGGVIAEQIAQEKVSSIAASPAFLERIVIACETGKQRLNSLSKVFVGGAPVFPPLLDRLCAIAPNAVITSVYGSTEAEPICELHLAEISVEDLTLMRAGRGLLAGKPVPSIGLRIVKERWGCPIGPYTSTSFQSDCVPSGAAGEIAVSGPHVLAGYLGGRGDEETKFRVDGSVWHRTGDCGYLDVQGRVWMLGRATARMADPRGELYPFSVECALSFIPQIRRSALIAAGGKRILFVEWHRERANESAIQELVAWASIDAIHSCPRIPVDRRHNAKIDYVALDGMARKLGYGPR
jgi:acyl-CoA synthetase (AMP-forming)/AMP-acid ligase II